MTTATKSSAASLRYVAALMDLAQEKKCLDKVHKDLGELAGMISKSADLALAIRSPLIGKTQKANSFNLIAEKAKFQTITKNFLQTLIHNGRLNLLEEIIRAFDSELARRRGEISVDVSVAQDLSAKQQKELQDGLKKALGMDVTLRLKVEPGILGGMIVTVGSYRVDDSVARKLERLQVAMNKQSNENPTNTKKAKEA